MCVCMRNGSAGDAARTHTHTQQARLYKKCSQHAITALHSPSCPIPSLASVLVLLSSPSSARTREWKSDYVCVYVCGMEERTTLRARTHTHNPPSLGSVLILDSSPSFARTRERKSEGHRAHIRVHSQSGPDKFSRPLNKWHGMLHKTDSGPQAHTATSE